MAEGETQGEKTESEEGQKVMLMLRQFICDNELISTLTAARFCLMSTSVPVYAERWHHNRLAYWQAESLEEEHTLQAECEAGRLWRMGGFDKLYERLSDARQA